MTEPRRCKGCWWRPAQEETWEYALPALEEPTATITIGMDRTCLLMCEDGWRETMVGTIGLYDRNGDAR